MPRRHPRKAGPRGQTGATIVEFAFVFPVVFLLFYGLLTYTLIFTVRMGLQHSAEEGARAALRYQAIDGAAAMTADERFAAQVASRISVAEATARQQASWMNGWTAPTVSAQVCLSGDASSADCSGAAGPVTSCGTSLTDICQIVVTVQFPYAAQPILPSLPGFGLIVPDRLVGQARVLLDGRTLSI